MAQLRFPPFPAVGTGSFKDGLVGGTIFERQDLQPTRTLANEDVQERIVKLYRINKVAKPGGLIIKKKHVLASSDHDAMKQAADSSDCPICDVLRDGERVGSIV
jgi:hypothetical protein